MVRREEHRPVDADVAQQGPDLAPRHGVHPRRRLVEDHESGPAGQRRGHHDLALLAARELERKPLGHFREAEELQQARRLVLRSRFLDALEPRVENEVLPEREPREQRVVLRAEAEELAEPVEAVRFS